MSDQYFTEYLARQDHEFRADLDRRERCARSINARLECLFSDALDRGDSVACNTITLLQVDVIAALVGRAEV